MAGQAARTRGTGSIRQKRRGVWQIRWDTGIGQNRRYRSETVRGTKTDAEGVLRQRLLERDRVRGSGVLATFTTVGEWLDHWLYHVAKQNIRPDTWVGYRSIVERTLVPEIGHLKLDRLSPADVQRFVSEHSDRPWALRYFRAVLRSALSEAERQGLVSRNVAKLVRVPPPPQKEVSPLTPEQAQAFLSTIEGHREEALYVLAMTLGMRQGELLGLTWDAVNLDEGVLTVRHTLKRYDGEYHLDPPKTKKSYRTLALPAPLVVTLRAHRAHQVRERLSSADWQGNSWDLVFCRTNGLPLDSKGVTQRFRRHLDRAGLPRVRFHDLRHGAATYLLRAGVPMRVVMEQLGHSQMAITSDLYSHVLPEAKREATDKVAALLLGS